MTFQTLLALSLFAAVTSITPGPNNLMLLASGVNFGFRNTFWHMLGISLGFFVLVLAVGLGLGQAFAAYPRAYQVMKWLGVGYMLYLAYRIAISPVIDANTNRSAKPLGLIEAALFQWVNPKAWVSAVGVFSAYVPLASSATVALGVAALYTIITVPCLVIWAGFGSQLRHVLQQPRYARIFNVSMAGLLVASLLPIIKTG